MEKLYITPTNEKQKIFLDYEEKCWLEVYIDNNISNILSFNDLEQYKEFSLTENEPQKSEEKTDDFLDADSFFNLPEDDDKSDKE